MNMLNNQLIDVGLGLKDRVAFVTGGLGGLGRATVQALLAHGAKVAFTYAEGQEPVAAAEELVAQAPDRLSAHALDLRFFTSIKKSLTEAQEKWGRLDILVNNAAVGSATVKAYAEDLQEQDSVMFSINSDGALKVCQLFVDLVKSQSEAKVNLKVINVSSVGGGYQAFPHFRLSDGMSKASVAFLTKCVAAAEVHSHVDVFAICPGAMHTKMFEASVLAPMSEKERQAYFKAMPKNRLIQPEELATIIVFLASQYSTPLHGSVLDASMGLGVRPGLITEMNLSH